jgi:hypothetical protein
MNQIDGKGQKQGYWEYYWSKNIIWSKGNYINDLEEGYWEWYEYEDNVLSRKGFYL